MIPRRGVTGAKSKAGRISYREFRYDEKRDVYVCPQGKRLKRTTYDARWDRYYYRPLKSDCRGCPIRESCCTAKAVRCITRPRQQGAVDRALSYLRSKEGQEVFARRGYTAEWVVAEAKGCHGLRRAMFRGLENVQIQGLMTASVQNLKRLLAASLDPPPRKTARANIVTALMEQIIKRIRDLYLRHPEWESA